MITYRNDLSITPISHTPVITLSKNDSDYILIFDLYTTVGSFTLQSNSSIKMVGTRKDGSKFELGGIINGLTATFNGNALLTTVPGEVIAELVLEHDEKRLATSNFIISVEPLF